jgi:hypothetical protein
MDRDHLALPMLFNGLCGRFTDCTGQSDKVQSIDPRGIKNRFKTTNDKTGHDIVPETIIGSNVTLRIPKDPFPIVAFLRFRELQVTSHVRAGASPLPIMNNNDPTSIVSDFSEN